MLGLGLGVQEADMTATLAKLHLPSGEIKFHYHDDELALRQFVQQGYVIYEGLIEPQLVRDVHDFIASKYRKLQLACKEDVNGFAVAIMRALERSPFYEQLVHSWKLVSLAKQYVGPDVAWFAHDGLFINMPADKDPVLLKGLHTDVWTGTGINTVFCAVFFTDCDEYNGLSVWPGSHLQGLQPVQNRALAYPGQFDSHFKPLNLSMVKAGDIVLWHPLTIHATTGHSDKNIRISMTSRFTSTETPMTSQERSLGYRVLSAGPLNQVMRLVGNDYLLPNRTLGGYVGVDRRMADVYNYSPYKTGIDYDQYLKE